jgi:hypothetical protein
MNKVTSRGNPLKIDENALARMLRNPFLEPRIPTAIPSPVPRGLR